MRLVSPADDSRAAIEVAIRQVFAPHLSSEGPRFAGAWRKTLRSLRPLGAVSLGNRVRVLGDGDEAFESLWATLASARRSVVFATYILEPDRVGERTLLELGRAAERGCRVLVVIDAFGNGVPEDRLARLRASGVTLVLFNPIVRWRAPFSRLVRNHRKVLVVDDERALCGGMNVAEEYAGARHGTGLFRDTQLFLEGPSARDLARLIERDTLGERPTANPAPGLARTPSGGSLVQILDSHVRRHRRAIQKALRITLARTLERCYLTSPYFVPPPRLMRALEHAARRGVDVQVLTAGRSDVPLVRQASQHLYGRLLRAGVRIFELESRVLHAKTVTADGVYASVGSFNLDHWSDRRNLEVSVTTLDRGAASALEQHFRQDLAEARERKLGDWRRRGLGERLLGWLAYQILRI
jgi:phosphatidylserine/phosphatidylglycerophosphate/cardiolipin synthase-like enzyme